MALISLCQKQSSCQPLIIFPASPSFLFPVNEGIQALLSKDTVALQWSVGFVLQNSRWKSVPTLKNYYPSIDTDFHLEVIIYKENKVVFVGFPDSCWIQEITGWFLSPIFIGYRKGWETLPQTPHCCSSWSLQLLFKHQEAFPTHFCDKLKISCWLLIFILCFYIRLKYRTYSFIPPPKIPGYLILSYLKSR